MDSQFSEIEEDGCYIALTHDHLNVQAIMDRVRSPQVGAIVLFAGKMLMNFVFLHVPNFI